MLVQALMNRKPVIVDTNSSLKASIPLMSDARSSCILIVEDNRPVGILTERDVTQLFSESLKGNCDLDRSIADVMTKEPVCVSEDSSFKDALMLSKSRKLRNLPVISDDDQLVGLVTQSSLIDAYATLVERQDELESSVEELQMLSLEDPLLRIGNRRAMEVDLTHTEADARRHNKTYALALLDVDYFKNYNDFYGHQKGDDALKLVADTIKETVRTSDRVFRYGGEEILILMPETDQKKGYMCSERVRAAIEAKACQHEKSPLSYLTVSAGVASATSGEWEEMIARADKALYKSKHDGRNRTTDG